MLKTKITIVKYYTLLLLILLPAMCAGCSKDNNAAFKYKTTESKEISAKELAANNAMAHSTDISSELTFLYTADNDYAKQYTIDEYEDGYALITVASDSQYLLVPEGKSVPGDISEEICVLRQPIDKIYLAASAAMDMFASIDGISSIKYTSLKEDSWYVDEAREAVLNGEIAYAGGYNAPDYELLLSGGSNLAVENTMIYHSPDTKEQLIRLGIPVFVDYSSYEEEPLGRTEWVKLYGRLIGHENEALEAFDEQASIYDSIMEEPVHSEKSVAFFYISSAGEAKVRKSSDYMAKMIELAGGKYVFDDLGADTNASSTVSMTMEEFYSSAKEADFIIYNSSIEGELNTISDLLAKSDVLANFKAVQEGNVFCTTQNVYQSSMETGRLIMDINHMLLGKYDDMKFLYRVTR